MKWIDRIWRHELSNAVIAGIVLGALGLAGVAILGFVSWPAKTEAPPAKSASTSRSGCEASPPTIPAASNAPGQESLLVDPNAALWSVILPEGEPLPLDSSVELPPLHVGVAHQFDPRLNVHEEVQAQVYLIFPRNDFTVKAPKSGWHQEPGSAANVVYCGDVQGLPHLSRGSATEVFWLTPLAPRPFSIQWQVAGTTRSGRLSSGLRGFTFKVTP